MSHFSTLVLAESAESVPFLLEPYMENCCGTPSYAYMEFYEDEDCERDPVKGKRGYWQNPDAKWDWYEEGGRFSNLLLTKGGERCDCAHVGDLDLVNGRFDTYAVVTPDGEWHAVGDMGWFGISSETPEQVIEWKRGYVSRFLENADPDLVACVCDCHI